MGIKPGLAAIRPAATVGISADSALCARRTPVPAERPGGRQVQVAHLAAFNPRFQPYTAGGPTHLLLVFAPVVAIIRLLQGRRIPG